MNRGDSGDLTLPASGSEGPPPSSINITAMTGVIIHNTASVIAVFIMN